MYSRNVKMQMRKKEKRKCHNSEIMGNVPMCFLPFLHVCMCVCVYVSFKKKHVLTAVLGPALWGKEMNETLPWPLGPTDQWQQELQAFLHHPRAFLKKASFPKEQ